MKIRGIHVYVGLTAALAGTTLAAQSWTVLLGLPSHHKMGLAALIALGVLSEGISIGIKVGSSASHSSVTFIPFLASVLLFGPVAGVLLALCIFLVSEFVLHKKPKIRAVFNVSQWIVVSAISGLAYTHLLRALDIPYGGYPPDLQDARLFIPFGAFVVTFFAVNYVAVAAAIAFDTGAAFTGVLKRIAGSAGANLMYGILISPVAFVVAVLYVQFDSYPLLALAIPVLPLLFIRQSYLTAVKLQRANQDLLKALVKAIETRDPYTSGHSLRVSLLASRIAEELHLSARAVEDVRNAALLHDIGKIDAVYSDILRKPDTLSEEERAVIESHVTKGVELLKSISSFRVSVIAAVRHHHEREDGKGYPDGLKGDAIPIGAKIIKVCDAIDAMLSDRPYRSALSLDQVREQLTTYAGTQFDARIVERIMRSDILERHRSEVHQSQEWSPAAILDQGMLHDEKPKEQGRRPSVLAEVRGA